MPAISLPLLSSLLYLSSTLPTIVQCSTTSSKRGLVYVTPFSLSDDAIWARASNGLTWYYNYKSTPTASLASSPHLSFVPMLWGAPASPTSPDTTFLDSVTTQLASGANITHILSYNEPDGPPTTGGSNLTPDAAANTWLRNIQPLRAAHGLAAGLPAITGSQRGITWLQSFHASCSTLNPPDGCAADFIPIHWYGDFGGLASHMGQIRALYPTLPIWITEYALPNAPLHDTLAFYNVSREYFERIDYVERYSYFGAFRSTKSNVGPNTAFLTGAGELTDLGSFYLGGEATGRVPEGGAGGRGRGEMGLVVGVGLMVAFWVGW